MEGVAHSVEVTAATLYEAVALDLRELQGNEWVRRHCERIEHRARFREECAGRSCGNDWGVYKMA